eukprot:gene513-biopygen5119
MPRLAHTVLRPSAPHSLREPESGRATDVPPGASYILAVDVLLTQIALISAGIGGGSCVWCGWMRVFDTIIALSFIALVLYRRPYRSLGT